MINGAELAQGLKDRLLSYMSSALPIGNHESQRLLGQKFFEEWQRGLFKGPYLETIPPYQRLDCLNQRFERESRIASDKSFADRMRPRFSWADVDHKFSAAKPLRNRLWPAESLEAQLERTVTTQQALWERGLFEHQWEAFNRAVYDDQNVVVATGTGSGKTECFQLPILYRLLVEPRSIRARRGVRALLVYPLNALVEDQSARLRRLLFWINLQFHVPGGAMGPREQITFGRYTGDTPVSANDHARRESDEALKGFGELVYREDMQACPPDILITNFTMLEYMLLREDDRQLFSAADLFSFIVLDEIHTYSGTQGMEVAMLLRRLKGFLEGRAGKRIQIQCIGTSATVGEENVKTKVAEFASTLFGTRFDSDCVILGKQLTRKSGARFEYWDAFLQLVSQDASIDALLQGDELPIDADFWQRLAKNLGLPHPPEDESAPASEKLGEILSKSGLVDCVRTAIETREDACIDLDSLAESMCPNAANPKMTVGKILGLLALSTRNHDPVLALRTHFFINEAKAGQLCLYSRCEGLPGGTDAWWRRLYLAHHASCDLCNSLVYSVVLCRRCGFVYLEGWADRSVLWPERDTAQKPDSYRRWLFRPVASDLPPGALEIGEARTLCLACGRYFVARDRETFAVSQANHKCPAERLIDIRIWRPEDLDGGKLESCLFCEQHWFSGEEVITPPAPSTYAVSTLLLEELKRRFSDSGIASKIISFSDSRQQAAQLALRLQGTNRDFSFRQMVYQITTEEGLSTDDLLEELFDFAKADAKLRLVLAADPARPANNAEVREQLGTLLYRDAVSAYLTLEAQGLARVEYDPRLFEAATEIEPRSRLLARLSEEERRHWFAFLLDWGMRFVRFGMGAAQRWGGPTINYDDLKEWNIYPKDAALFRSDEPGIFGFLLKQRNKKNTVFNFAARLIKRGIGDRSQLDIEEFQAAVRPFWDTILACERLWAKDALTADRPLLNAGGLDADRCLIRLNFSALHWRKPRIDEPLFQCDHCGRLSFYSIKSICPIRDCTGTLRCITQCELDDRRFSPVRHYRTLVTSARVTPLRVEEHTAQISSDRRIAIERDFRSTAENSVDVVCGSTTFELGIDLGAIQSVFMSNLPPRVSNYRQRAGRAGRRPGTQPFVVNYVRQRPHDQYFWSVPQWFIAGPLPVPRLALSSEEVVRRHASAILVARLLELYRKDHPGKMMLAGPPAGDFVDFALSDFTEIKIGRELGSKEALSERLDHLLRELPIRIEKAACWADLRSRLRRLRDTYLPLYLNEGCLDVLSDHAILPSYAFPIHVDELRLRECPLREAPRSELKLQRDRSIALREYSPGRAFVAGKYQILSEGLWSGYETKDFGVCPQCSMVDFRSSGTGLCSKCRLLMSRKKAVVPLGGFFGRVIRSASESAEQAAPDVTDV
ncbi:MAG TPA: DEAD/DEAH box helicase, partial [Terriglobales bacterium]|nr:DEAD/DEAH box helicase [Terriglobales bacterium]